MLFALACPERAASLAKLNIRYHKILPEGVVFSFTSPRKRGNPNHSGQAFFAHFPHNRKLCPVETLCHYLKKWHPVCPTLPCPKPDPLLISYIKPYKQVSSATVGCWLGLTIKDVGINMEIFKAHSVHSYIIYSHVFRPDFVKYNFNYTRAAKRRACIIGII